MLSSSGFFNVISRKQGAKVMSLYDENLKRIQTIAQANNLVLNPDEARIQKVVGNMTKNYEAVGEYICPCKQTHHPPVQGKDVLCPCPDMMDEIARVGRCHCKLFYTPDAAIEAKKDQPNESGCCCKKGGKE
jgi:ferredoxin-thioredoxin reductase catalytic subunit